MAIKAKDKYLFEQNTYKAKVKDDDADRIEVEIGDAKQPDFKPQLKVMRWDNEVNFSIRAEEVAGATLEEDGEKIKYVTPDYDVVQYDKPDAGEDGGFEFEWVLKKKPKTNILTTTIETKGLTFYKQFITQQQKDDWNWEYTAPNIEGSYAAYHSSKSGNYLGKKNYKTGKAFHIYRPEAVDANGDKIFCDIDIDYPNKALRVTVPQDFLDNALYPVIVDPTFGFTTIGLVTGSGTSTLVLGYRGQNPGESGTLTQIEHYCKDASNGGLQFGIYETSPSAKVESTTAVTLNGTAAWFSKAMTSSITAQAYDLCCHFQLNSGTYYHDTTSSYTGDPPGAADDGYSAVAYGTWNSSITWTNWPTRLSIFATYTAAPAGGGGDIFPVLKQNKFWTPRS